LGFWLSPRGAAGGGGGGGFFNSVRGGGGGGGGRAGGAGAAQVSARARCAINRGGVACCAAGRGACNCIRGRAWSARGRLPDSLSSPPPTQHASPRAAAWQGVERGGGHCERRAPACAAWPRTLVTHPPPPLVSLFPAVDAPPPPPCRRPVDTMSSAGLPGPLPTSRAGGMGAPAPPPRAARPKSPSPRGPPLSCLIPPTATSMACPLPAVAPPPQPGARVRSATVAFPSKRCAPAPAPVAPWTTMPPTEGWRDGQYWALAEVREMGAGALGAPGESRGARGSRAGGAPRDTGQQKGGPD